MLGKDCDQEPEIYHIYAFHTLYCKGTFSSVLSSPMFNAVSRAVSKGGCIDAAKGEMRVLLTWITLSPFCHISSSLCFKCLPVEYEINCPINFKLNVSIITNNIECVFFGFSYKSMSLAMPRSLLLFPWATYHHKKCMCFPVV